MASYKLTFGASLIGAFINVIFGGIVAWVLVRYEFPASASSTRWWTCRSRCPPPWPASR
jgi:ABC-type sulfate transport system permease subunit